MEKLKKVVAELGAEGFVIKIDQFKETVPGFAGPAICVHTAGEFELINGTKIKSDVGDVLLKKAWFDGQKEFFTEDRLIIVLFHEIGHVLYHRSNPLSAEERRNPAEMIKDEIAAFEYSLSKCIELFDHGNKLPLKEILFWITVRSKNPKDYPEAIKNVVESQKWNSAWMKFLST